MGKICKEKFCSDWITLMWSCQSQSHVIPSEMDNAKPILHFITHTLNFLTYIAENLNFLVLSWCTFLFTEQRMSTLLCARNPSFVCLFWPSKELFPTYHKCETIFLILFDSFPKILYTFVHGTNMRVSTCVYPPNH